MVAQDVAGIVLASGMSRRFEWGNKLLVPVEGMPVVRRTVGAYLDAGLAPVLVVVGHDGDRVSLTLQGLHVQFVENPQYAAGQSRALVRGLQALGDDVAAAVIGVADQPFLAAGVIRELVELRRSAGLPLAVPRYRGQRGNPVLFDRRMFDELLQVGGDEGGRTVIKRHQDQIAWLDVPDARSGEDVDTIEDYRRLTE